MKPILVANWTTPRCTAPAVVSFTQDEEEWCDFKGYQDLGLLIDCTALGELVGGTAIPVFLNLESSPTVDDALFQPVCPPINLSPSSTILSTKTIRVPSTQGLARFFRWRISVDGSSSGPWGATFRIRAIPIKSRFFVPPDIAGCQLWVRADLGVTFGVGGGGVSTWEDQSGQNDSARNFTQSGAGAQPAQTIRDADYNSMATLSFGVDDGMISSPWGVPDTGTFFVVGNGDGAITQRTFFSGDLGHLFAATSSTSVRYSDGVALSATVVTTNLKHVYAIGANGGSSQIFQDSPTALTTGDAGAGGPTTMAVGYDGTTNFLNGKIAEMIMYDSILSEGDRTKVLRYLGARYGIRITP